MQSTPCVLLITHSGDYYTIDRVQEHLQEFGYKTLRFNTDEYPTRVKINQCIGLDSAKASITIEGETVNLSEIAAVWIRKVAPPNIEVEMDPVHRKGCLQESSYVLGLLFSLLEDRPTLDSLSRMQAAENKLSQQRAARLSGLQIPETLISNDPDAVKQFYYAQGGAVVAKLLTSLSHSMEGASPTIYTSTITEEDLADLDSLQFSPMTFQQKIAKAYELRVIYVNGRCYTGKIVLAHTKKGQDDWRKATPAQQPWEAYALPESMQTAIDQLMQRLNLSFGALDLICTPAGEYYFLEVNPAGEWGMLEQHLALPISLAIAETLRSIATRSLSTTTLSTAST